MHISRRQNVWEKILRIAVSMCIFMHVTNSQLALESVRGFVPCDGKIPFPTSCRGGTPPGALTNIQIAGGISFSDPATAVLTSAWSLVPPENSVGQSLTVCTVGQTCQLTDVNTTVSFVMSSPRIAYVLDDAIGALPYGIALVNYSVANGRSSLIEDPTLFASTANLTCGGLSAIEMATRGGLCSSTYPLPEISAQGIADGGWCGVNPYAPALTSANNPQGVDAFNNGPDCATGVMCYACPGSNSASTVYRPMAFGRICTVYPIGANPTILVDIVATVTTTDLLGVTKVWTINVASINVDGGPVTNVSEAGNLRLSVDVTSTASVVQTLPGYIVVCTPPGGSGDPRVTGIMGPTNSQINTRGYVPTFNWNNRPSVGIAGMWQYWAPTTFSGLVSNTGECGKLTLLNTPGQPVPSSTQSLYNDVILVNRSCANGTLQAGACVPGFVDTTMPATPCQIDTFNQRYSDAYLASTLTRPALSPYLIPDWNPEHPQYYLDYLANGDIVLVKNLVAGAQGSIATVDATLSVPTVVVPYNVIDNNTLVINTTDTACTYTVNEKSGFVKVKVCQLGDIPLTRINVTITNCPSELTFVYYTNSTWGVSDSGNTTTFLNQIAIDNAALTPSCVTTPPSYYTLGNTTNLFQSDAGGTFGACTITINGLLVASSGAWVNWVQQQQISCAGISLPPPDLPTEGEGQGMLPNWITAVGIGLGAAVVAAFVIAMIVVIVMVAKKSKSAEKIKSD